MKVDLTRLIFHAFVLLILHILQKHENWFLIRRSPATFGEENTSKTCMGLYQTKNVPSSTFLFWLHSWRTRFNQIDNVCPSPLDTALLKRVSEYAVPAYTSPDSAVSHLNRSNSTFCMVVCFITHNWGEKWKQHQRELSVI